MDTVTRMTQRNKVIYNGETYYHKYIQTQDKDWTEIYDGEADSNFLFMEKGRLPIRVISVMLKAYQRGLMIGRFKTMIEVKPKMLKSLFRYRLRRNIEKHRKNSIGI